MNTFPYYLKLNAMDYGPTCLRMIAKYYGKNHSQQILRTRPFILHEKIFIRKIGDKTGAISFHTSGVRYHFETAEEKYDIILYIALNSKIFCSML